MESRFSHLAVNTLFPRFCLGCEKEGSLWCGVCDSAWNVRVLSAACPFCSKSGSDRVCDGCEEGVYLDGLSSFVPYGNPVVRGALNHWKYYGDVSAERVIKKWLQQSVSRLVPPFFYFSVAHVPAHETRKRARGFDQAEKVSHFAAEIFGKEWMRLLHRKQKTRAQAGVHHLQRRVGELDGVYEIHPGVQELPENVLLCDDVFTSGATMDAAAKCLKEAGVKKVWGFVVAKGG
jgi:predicted amidophosphoribosyltransferase